MATEFNTQVGNGEYRLQFETNNEAHYLLMQSAARRCIDHAHMTNADRIRSMTDEELAEQLGLMTTICELCAKQKNCADVQDYNYCMEGILEWLQQPAKEGE